MISTKEKRFVVALSIVAFFFAMVVGVFVFTDSVYADFDPSIYDFTLWEVPVCVGIPTSYDDVLVTGAYHNHPFGIYLTSSPDSPIYVSHVSQTSNITVFSASSFDISTVRCYYYLSNSSTSPTNSSVYPSSLSGPSIPSGYSFYYMGVNSSYSGGNSLSPSSDFTSSSQFFAAAQYFLDNPVVSTTYTYTGSIPPNSLLVVDLGTGINSHTFNLSAVMPEGSSLFGGTPWPQSGQRFGVTNTLPTSNTNIPGLVGNSIPWTKSGKTNIVGVTTSASATVTLDSSYLQYGRYLLFYNPMYWASGGSTPAEYFGDVVLSPTVSVSITDVVGASVYSLYSSLDLSNGIGDVSANPVDEFTAVYDESTDTWSYVDSDGNPTILPSTGDNEYHDHVNSIASFLQSIADDIANFFNGAIGAIQTLVSSASAFVGSIGGLYSWLPGPVYSVLVSALVLAITIGVIKVFL